jgi:hypothetical protein
MSGVTAILYFHGFRSSPASAKIAELRPRLAQRAIEMITPDLNLPSFERLDFDAIVDHAVALGRRLPPRLIAGSSMGALVALAVAKHGFDVPLVLIAPAIGLGTRWVWNLPEIDPIPVFHHTRNEKVPIHRAFFEQMARLRVDDEPPAVRVTAIMGRNDETVPFPLVEACWHRWEASGGLVPGSKLIEIPEGDHELAGQGQLIEEMIVESLS